MTTRKIKHEVRGLVIEQRPKDGFINGTAMCQAFGKEIRLWFRSEEVFQLFSKLSYLEGITTNSTKNPVSSAARLSATRYAKTFPGLIIVRQGSPANGGGTWLHPKLAIQLAQWCSPTFALQVSDWVMHWMMTGGQEHPVHYPQFPEVQRIDMRLELKDEARILLMDAVWRYYKDSGVQNGAIELLCAKVHDEINKAITGSSSSQIRQQLSEQLGRDMRASELIRDYFPTDFLSRYAQLCNATTHFIRQGYAPFDAIRQAVPVALIGWEVRAIQFAPHFKRLKALGGAK